MTGPGVHHELNKPVMYFESFTLRKSPIACRTGWAEKHMDKVVFSGI